MYHLYQKAIRSAALKMLTRYKSKLIVITVTVPSLGHAFISDMYKIIACF